MNWRPAASLDALKLRARILARVRTFFARRDVLEVETPMLSAAGSTDPNLHSFIAYEVAPDAAEPPRYLHTSPELAMKRLIAGGSGSIYQIARVFRAGETGRLHNPEFTLLEWYRIGLDYRALMAEVAELVVEALEEFRTFEAPEMLSYRDAFQQTVGLNPHAAGAPELAMAARRHGIEIATPIGADSDAWRDLLLTHLIEPHLGRGRLTFLYDYPASQAALARVRPGYPPLAERFELYLDGIELANGFQELTDAAEQRRRFARDGAARRERGLPDVPPDARFLAALEAGLPECSGVALGLDRLILAAAGAQRLSEVLSVPFDKA